MDLTDRNLWQVGAGDTERSYGDICKRFDVLIAGPGDPGPYSDEKYRHYGDIRHSLRRIWREAKRGDIVLLRLGTNRILAVGEIADSEAGIHEAFADIDGWDLQHCRRVRWIDNTEKTFPIRTLGGQVRTFSAVKVKVVRDWVEGLTASEAELNRDLAVIPEPGRRLALDELGKLLFIEGLPSEYADKLMHTFSSLQRLASWYWNKTKRPTGRPSENETICYLVVPLLFSLGWSQQTAAIEWNRVDIALFSGMPPTDNTLRCVVEAKFLNKSVFLPVGQAKHYALEKGREQCDKLIVTDGIRYGLHRRSGRDFILESYLNILDTRESYPVLGCGGAIQAILGMAR